MSEVFRFGLLESAVSVVSQGCHSSSKCGVLIKTSHQVLIKSIKHFFSSYFYIFNIVHSYCIFKFESILYIIFPQISVPLKL